jgi:hypothetical protein
MLSKITDTDPDLSSDPTPKVLKSLKWALNHKTIISHYYIVDFPRVLYISIAALAILSAIIEILA